MKPRWMLLLIALALAGLLIFRPKHRAETPPDAPAAAKTAAPATEPPLTASAATEPAAAPAVAPTFASGGIGAPAATATVPAEIQVELDNVKLLIRDYRLALGENPVGSNAEITRALTGANLKKTRFVAAGVARLNERGEWVDPWRTPYFFHQISGREMEIRSAGPDRRMWTADDIVLR